MESFSLQAKHIFYIVLYSTISVAAVGGNSIVIYLIAKYRRMRSVTNLFLLNCALGDLLMALLCIPFTSISNLLLDTWIFGLFMCHLITYAQAVSVFVSAYTLVAISFDRYIAIIYPLRPRMTRRHCLQLIGLIWLVALLTPLPTALLSRLFPITKEIVLNSTSGCVPAASSATLPFSATTLTAVDLSNISLYEQHLLLQSNQTASAIELTSSDNNDVGSGGLTPCSSANGNSSTNLGEPPPESTEWPIIATSVQPTPTKYQCIEDWSWADDTYRSYYSMLLMTLQYLLPFTVLVFTYTRIAIVVWGKRAPGEADNERDAKMAASKRKMIKMMVACVLAFTLCWLPFNILIILGEYYNVYDYEYIEYIWVATHWLAMSHAVYNPVIYITMNPRFRYGFRRVLGKCVPCLLPESTEQTTNGGGRSMANIFNSSQQRKRLASQYNCYSFAKAAQSNASTLQCHQGGRTNQSTAAAAAAGSASSSKLHSLAQKRFSCVPTDANANANVEAPTTNGRLSLHCEIVKSQSYNCVRERNGASTTLAATASAAAEGDKCPTQEDSLL